MRKVLQAIMAASLLAPAQMAVAETLTVAGVYPAENSQAAALESIAIEPIGGADGGALATMIGDRLRGATIEGEPWLRVFAGSIGGDAEAALSGYVTTQVSIDQSYPKQVSRCIERDERRKCIEKIKEDVPCDRARIRVSPGLRVVARDGSLLHTDNVAVTREIRFCADENQPSFDPLIDQALVEIANRVRFDLAPQYRRESFRVLESRKGMEREAGRQFRDAIRLTKNDELAACYAFDALEQEIGAHRSLLFNLGLCAEAAEEFDIAETYYTRALSKAGDTSYANAGLARIAARRTALEQLNARLAQTDPTQ